MYVMKIYPILSISILLLTLSMTCQKKGVNVITEGKDREETITINQVSDRNDIPPPPDTAWWTLDTTNLDYCEQRLWDYLKTMYPIDADDYWNYHIYAIKDEPGDLLENRALVSRYIHFFIDTIYSRNGLLYDPEAPCDNIDSTFFLKALGPPTCRSYHPGFKQVNYFYSFKLRYRHGPCPYIFDEGNEFEHFCYSMHFDYCALLMMHFSEKTGKLTYISFYGAGS